MRVAQKKNSQKAAQRQRWNTFFGIIRATIRIFKIPVERRREGKSENIPIKYIFFPDRRAPSRPQIFFIAFALRPSSFFSRTDAPYCACLCFFISPHTRRGPRVLIDSRKEPERAGHVICDWIRDNGGIFITDSRWYGLGFNRPSTYLCRAYISLM